MLNVALVLGSVAVNATIRHPSCTNLNLNNVSMLYHRVETLHKAAFSTLLSQSMCNLHGYID